MIQFKQKQIVQMLRKWNFEIQLVKESDQAIYLQIADAIIQDIQAGRLKAGDPLPGSRSIAQHLKVNRNTVVEALNVLTMEGWLISKERRGTFVADTLQNIKEVSEKQVDINANQVSFKKQYHLRFDDGSPNSKIAPISELARAYRHIFNQKARWQMVGYSHELNDLQFRKSIAQMLNYQRGMQINEHNIYITRGSQMAIYLTAHYLFKENDYIIVENPGYQPAWAAFENGGAKLLPVAVDKEGLLIEEVIHHLKSGKKIKAIYVTPHHQYPTTVTLSLKRRRQLIQLSNEYGFTIIEDDYDNEFHFGYRPILPLSSFTDLKNYVYIGTLSKVVAPALRIGYLVSNDDTLMQEVKSLRKIIDVQGDHIMEQAVLQLIKDGTIKRHIRKATLHYKAKRDFMATLLDQYLYDKATYSLPEGGLAFWIVPNQQVKWPKIAQKLENKGIEIITPDKYSFDKTINGIRLGYSSLSEKELEKGIIALADAL